MIVGFPRRFFTAFFPLWSKATHESETAALEALTGIGIKGGTIRTACREARRLPTTP